MRRALLAIPLLALAVVADTLLWRFEMFKLHAGVDRWIDQARTAGWSVNAGSRQDGGWPFLACLTITDVGISGGGHLMPGGLAWSASRLVLKLSVFHPTTLLIDAGGFQRLRLSHAPELVMRAATFSVAVPLWSAPPATAQLVADDVSGGLRGSGHPDDVHLAGLRIRFVDQRGHMDAPGSLSARLDIDARDVLLPDIGHWPLGAVVSSAGGTVLLSPPPRQAPGVASTDPEDQARMWRDGGGSLDLRDLRLHWGPLRLTGNAGLGLDARLQPAGSGRADIVGSSQALDALVGGGVLPSGLAATGKALLAVMAHVPDNPDAVRLPFILRDNTLSVGQIPVVRINDIAWAYHAPK